MRRYKVLKDSKYRNFNLIQRTREEQGYHKEILDRAIELIEYMTFIRKRTYGVMLTFNFPENKLYPQDNKIFLKFREKFKDYFDNRNIDTNYIWVLEKGQKATNIHYHVMFLFNAYKVYSMFTHGTALTRLWAKAIGIKDATGLVHYKQPGKLLNYDKSDYEKKYAELIKWSSYLAKLRDKLNIRGIRNWGSSTVPKWEYS